MGEHGRGAVADAVNEQHGGQIDEYLNKKVRGNQNGYLGKLDTVLRLECQKQQRREIVDDRLNDERRKARRDGMFIAYLFHFRSPNRELHTGAALIINHLDFQTQHKRHFSTKRKLNP